MAGGMSVVWVVYQWGRWSISVVDGVGDVDERPMEIDQTRLYAKHQFTDCKICVLVSSEKHKIICRFYIISKISSHRHSHLMVAVVTAQTDRQMDITKMEIESVITYV